MISSTRSEKIDLRVSAENKHILQTAASVARRSLSEFVLESAMERAQETLPNRQAFGLDAERWEAFLTALDAPVRSMPRLSRLLGEPSVFE